MMTDILKEALSRGHLISPDALPLVRQNASLLDAAGNQIVITKKALDRQTPSKLSVLFECSPTQQERKVESLVEFYKNRFDVLKADLLKKADSSKLVSVKNPGTIGSDTLLIGMVREVSDGWFLMDDGTGNMKIISEKPVIEDTVLMVKGRVAREGVVAEQIIFPDVPINREVKMGKGSALVLGSDRIDVEKVGERVKHVFAMPSASKEDLARLERKDLEIVMLSERNKGARTIGVPSAVKLENGMTIVFFENPSMNQGNSILHIRSRHLDPKRYLEGDPLLLRDLPDIAVCVSGKDFFVNYKGTTLISADRNSYMINFETREVELVK